MIRFCDGNDPNLLDLNGNPCRCKLRFDDGDRTVIYPHHPTGGGRFGGRLADGLTRAARAASDGEVFGESATPLANRPGGEEREHDQRPAPGPD